MYGLPWFLQNVANALFDFRILLICIVLLAISVGRQGLLKGALPMLVGIVFVVNGYRELFQEHGKGAEDVFIAAAALAFGAACAAFSLFYPSSK